MVPLLIYKDKDLRRQFTKPFIYENKGVNGQRKWSGSLECREVLLVITSERVVYYDFAHVTRKNCEFGKYKLYPSLVRGENWDGVVYNYMNE